MEIEKQKWAEEVAEPEYNGWPETADPGYTLAYARLFEEKESAKAETFSYESDKGRIDHVYLKREIPTRIKDETYFDITTPYGYGGPVIVYGEDTEGLMHEYSRAFHEYCQDNRIVSEFVRFHLFESKEVRDSYNGEVTLIGSHIVKPLNYPLNTNMSSDVRRSLKKADQLGMTINVDTTGEHIEQFLSIYYEMLIRHQASSYYHFPRSFFDHMHKDLQGRFAYVSAGIDGKTICSRLVIFGEKYGFGFLGGTLKDYFYTQATTVVDYHILRILKDRDCLFFSFGGGLKENDGIYKYKRKFNKDGDQPFYVGKTIHLPGNYDELVRQCQSTDPAKSSTTFFPLYRA